MDSVAQGTPSRATRTPVRPLQGGHELQLYRLAGEPGDVALGPLGYAAAALESYSAFVAARDAGTIPADARFQVSLPTPLAVVPAEICFVLEVPEVAAQFPMDVLVGAIARISAVPSDVELGLHLCYSDPGHRHIVEPRDTGLMVELAGELLDAIDRPVSWVHMPVPRERHDDAYSAPLGGLRSPTGTELYLELVHLTDGLDGGPPAPPGGGARRGGLRRGNRVRLRSQATRDRAGAAGPARQGGHPGLT